MQEDEIPGGALRRNLLTTMGIFPCREKFPWQNRESNPGPHDQQSETLTTRPRGWSDTQCTCKVKMQCVRLTAVAMENPFILCVCVCVCVCVVELYVSIYYIKISSVAQCFYGEFRQSATIIGTQVFFYVKCPVLDGKQKKKTFLCSCLTFFRRTVGLNRS